MKEHEIVGARKTFGYTAQFIMSAAHFKDLPGPIGEEFAILGRSNVGKSSFLNHVLEDKTLARVSKTPGKTSLANLYKLDSNLFFVDFPGYGYAKVSGDEKVRWSKLIREYAEQRANCAGIIWLLDIRHPGTRSDREAVGWLSGLRRPILPVLTKCDKLTRINRLKNKEIYRAEFALSEEPVLYSIRDNDSRRHFWERFERWRSGRPE